MSASIELTKGSRIATLRLVPDQPHRPPTFDPVSLQSLDDRLAELEESARRDEIALLFIESTSAKAFCAGANLVVLRTLDSGSIAQWVADGHRVFGRLEELPVPTIARVEGFALGGGLELALACDFIFASTAARFGQTEATLGLVTGWGASARLAQRVGASRAKHMLFSGRIISACDAYVLGLVDFSGDRVSLDEECRRFATEVLTGSSLAHREHKRMLQQGRAFERSLTLQTETEGSRRCMDCEDTRSRIDSFLSKRR